MTLNDHQFSELKLKRQNEKTSEYGSKTSMINISSSTTSSVHCLFIIDGIWMKFSETKLTNKSYCKADSVGDNFIEAVKSMIVKWKNQFIILENLFTKVSKQNTKTWWRRSYTNSLRQRRSYVEDSSNSQCDAMRSAQSSEQTWDFGLTAPTVRTSHSPHLTRPLILPHFKLTPASSIDIDEHQLALRIWSHQPLRKMWTSVLHCVAVFDKKWPMQWVQQRWTVNMCAVGQCQSRVQSSRRFTISMVASAALRWRKSALTCKSKCSFSYETNHGRQFFYSSFISKVT